MSPRAPRTAWVPLGRGEVAFCLCSAQTSPAMLTSVGLQMSLPYCRPIIYLVLFGEDSVLAFWSEEATLVG